MPADSTQAGTAAVLCLAVLAMLPATGAAEDSWRNGTEVQSVELKFRFAPAALATARGARDAYRRLVRSARRACSFPGMSSAHLKGVDSHCVAELVDKAIDRIGSARLAQQRGRDRSIRLAQRP